ncbi:hypothetical protein POX_h09430 [Penicillium oxalicum]|uniref:hypothetical protein n=1 Tax=Penicillium oxalicum TaxID=69781 RepID=UPI0020B8FA5D|nr:hypothetical protein POX_h09430 [Penicillium oxalicum]KAI2785672.1 hypothetical protein POX_h09430 [Penicillium oxalicum]
MVLGTARPYNNIEDSMFFLVILHGFWKLVYLSGVSRLFPCLEILGRGRASAPLIHLSVVEPHMFEYISRHIFSGPGRCRSMSKPAPVGDRGSGMG